VAVTDQPIDQALAAQGPHTLAELAQAQHIIPLRSIEDLRADELWESDDEINAFLADLATTRHTPEA